MAKATITLSRRAVYQWARDVLSHSARGMPPRGAEMVLMRHLHKTLGASEWARVWNHGRVSRGVNARQEAAKMFGRGLSAWP